MQLCCLPAGALAKAGIGRVAKPEYMENINLLPILKTE